mmetsp:Transcript_23860/g.62906  ORF Transcript_23860/g.62906 Transcript_23860/m.62906 type:complete len:232 (-) Transcript_23860:468-1163(-)
MTATGCGQACGAGLKLLMPVTIVTPLGWSLSPSATPSLVAMEMAPASHRHAAATAFLSTEILVSDRTGTVRVSATPPMASVAPTNSTAAPSSCLWYPSPRRTSTSQLKTWEPTFRVSQPSFASASHAFSILANGPAGIHCACWGSQGVKAARNSFGEAASSDCPCSESSGMCGGARSRMITAEGSTWASQRSFWPTAATRSAPVALPMRTKGAPSREPPSPSSLTAGLIAL